METFGEDPLLVSEMGRAIIQGYQGDGTASSVSRTDKVLACMKHFMYVINCKSSTPTSCPFLLLIVMVICCG
jgi:hypothetical protein